MQSKLSRKYTVRISKAAEIKGLTGIELDIQMTRDGELVVFHDEK